MNLCGFRATVMHGDTDQDVFRITFSVFDKHIEVAVVVEDASVEKFVFHLLARAPPVRLHQIAIGIFSLGILVQVLHVRVCRCAVEIKVVFLDVLAVIAFAVGQPEKPFFQDRVATVP